MSENTTKGKGKRTAATTGGGAATGAVIGGIAGGGKGAAIAAGIGAGAGFAGGELTGNSQIKLPAEISLSFQLINPVTLKWMLVHLILSRMDRTKVRQGTAHLDHFRPFYP